MYSIRRVASEMKRYHALWQEMLEVLRFDEGERAE